MDKNTIRSSIAEGSAVLGIELGSTRIKAVLIGPDCAPVASGSFAWENRYENELWTYPLDEVWNGLRAAYAELAAEVMSEYGVKLTRLKALGVSAMMHGYLAFDADGQLLTPFRTWRNTVTGEAAAKLSALFDFNIPQRWSIAHLHQAILNGEEHVGRIDFLTTLAGYVHWRLTGRRVLGVGDASGMFPIDSKSMTYDAGMVQKYEDCASQLGAKIDLRRILPEVLPAGADAGALTEEGARLLDPTGALEAGCPLAPPEGDAGTGMAATNSVTARTGNVSAGTSVFAMIVLERMPEHPHEEIDLVTTPSGKPVAMVHCNNCTNEINAWAEVFGGLLERLGQKPDMNAVYGAMFSGALDGERDGGGIVAFNYLSGEPVAGLSDGRPLMARTPAARLTFDNLMRVQLYSALATLKLGLDILSRENVAVDSLMGHGGFFKTGDAGQRIMAAAVNAPVSVMETAGEGGPWGMALLASYRAEHGENETLEDFLSKRVFAGQKCSTLFPDTRDVEGFEGFMRRYTACLDLERSAIMYVTE